MPSLLTDSGVDPDCLMAVVIAQAMNMVGTSDIFPCVGAYRVIVDKLIEFKGRVYQVITKYSADPRSDQPNSSTTPLS